MAERNLAKMIYFIAKNDKRLDQTELYELYKKKIEIDANELFNKLKIIVSDYIKNNFQPVCTSIYLNELEGCVAEFIVHEPWSLTPEKTKRLINNIYVYKNDSTYIEITNCSSQLLIKHAIIPLNLKWEISNYELNRHVRTGNIKISWDHWPKN
jgi:hypothetical protein